MLFYSIVARVITNIVLFVNHVPRVWKIVTTLGLNKESYVLVFRKTLMRKKTLMHA